MSELCYASASHPCLVLLHQRSAGENPELQQQESGDEDAAECGTLDAERYD